MPERPADNGSGRQTGGWLEPGPQNVQLIYFLYLAGLAIGITPLIGIVMAYLNRGKAGGWIETHYDWAIRTFWIGIFYAFIAALLTVVAIGFLLIPVVVIWLIVRCIVGLQAVGRGEALKNPQSWTL